MTAKSTKVARGVGWLLTGLVGVAMLLSGAVKMPGVMAPDPEAPRTGLEGHTTVIGVGEIVCAVLLLVPRTLPFGVWMTSAFWGGAICFHMSRGESYVLQSVFLLMTWVGAALREPGLLRGYARAAPVAGPALTPADG